MPLSDQDYINWLSGVQASLPPEPSEAARMKRIEAEMRAPAVQLSTSGENKRGQYTGMVRAQGGPLSAMGTVTPGAVMGRVGAGPVSYQQNYTGGGQKPIQSVQVGGMPFDADTYFGVGAQRSPGGDSYNANISRGGFNAGASYNPTQRALNVQGQYETKFAGGGPVHMEGGGFEEAPPLTIYRKSPPKAPEGERDQYAGVPSGEAYSRRFADTLANIPQSVIDYFNEKAAPPLQRLAEDAKPYVEGFANWPSAIGNYFSRKTDQTDPSQRVSEDVQNIGRGLGHMAAENPIGTAIDFTGIGGAITAIPEIRKLRGELAQAEAEGDVDKALGIKSQMSMNLTSMLPVVGGLAKAATKGSKLAAEAAKAAKAERLAEDASKVERVAEDASAAERAAGEGAAPARRSGQSLEEIVASMSKVDPQEVAAVRQENVGRGLEFPEEEALDRLRMNLQRQQKAVEKGTALPGGPANKRMVIRAPEEKVIENPTAEQKAEMAAAPKKPDFVVGDITPKDWVARAETLMSPEEIKDASKWYSTIRGEFLKYTNGDAEKADKYMRSWLVAQQNVDVGGAMNNVLFQREQLARGIPEAEMRAAGMPNPTGAARAVLKDAPIEGGVGQKIADFVDAAEGKSARSWMANHPEGGAPFVVDVHTARDTGMVDEKLLNHLRRLGYNEEDIQKVAIDLNGTPSATQYENRALWGRKDLVNYLNEIEWQGKKDWTPSEAQAVGWMGMTRLTADKAEDVVSGIERNVRRISFEIAPGEGSPWAAQFGDRFSVLPLERQQEITKTLAEPAMEAASKLSGIDLTNLVHGTGGWNMYQNPAAVGQALATKEGSEIATNTLGYLLQQTEVWSNSVKPMTKTPASFAVDFIQETKGNGNLATNEGLRDFWANVQKFDPTAGSKKPLFVGYQPIMTADGKPGIRVLIDRGGAKTQSDLEAAIKGPLSKMLDEMPIEVSATGHEAEISKARNDWKGQNNGQAYLERLEQLLGRNPAADLDPIRRQLEALFERELQAGPQGQKGKAKGGLIGYAKGGAVSSAVREISDKADKADLKVPQLAYMIRVASGMNMPPERAKEFAQQILMHDLYGLTERFNKYSNARRTLMRVNAMIGGAAHKNTFKKGGLFQKHKSLDVAKHAAGGMLASGMGHPVMRESLQNMLRMIK